MIVRNNSLQGNTCGNIFTARFIYLMVVIHRKKRDAHLALPEVFQEEGAPNGINKGNSVWLNLIL